ncbi:hypothetical protein OHA10_14350 [Kribbella sp. NBC_00662]
MIALLVLVAAVCRALNRNQRRQIRPALNGIEDRDLQRLVADLRAIS